MTVTRGRSRPRPVHGAPNPIGARSPKRPTPGGPVAGWVRQGTPAAIYELQRLAGNRAVSLALQRYPPAPDKSKGERWNDGKVFEIEQVRRVMVTGLKGGTSGKFVGGDSEHTDEPGDHRAVVLVSAGFDPEQPTEVLLYFHGNTETWRGRYAGWRQRTFKPTDETRKQKIASDGTVRDVALDQIEQQLHHSGHVQIIGILPQGSPGSGFGDIAGDDYIRDVLEKANKIAPAVLKSVPASWKVVLSGHSGGGGEVLRQIEGSKIKNLEGIILFDAEAMAGEITTRINEDLDVLSDITKSDDERKDHLAKRPAVRVFAREGGKYGNMYKPVVDGAIKKWKDRHVLGPRQTAEMDRLLVRDACTPEPGRPACKPLNRAEASRLLELGKRQQQAEAVDRFEPTLRKTYQVTLIDPAKFEHEEIIRGTKTSDAQYVKGEGTLEQGLRSLP